MQGQGELENRHEETFLWNNDRGGFDLADSKDCGDEALYRLLGEGTNVLVTNLSGTMSAVLMSRRFLLSKDKRGINRTCWYV